MPKNRFKKLAKLKVTDYWRQMLVTECTSPSLTSLRYFNPQKASLHKPHPIWTSTAGNSYECGKGTILARMVSGRYRTEMMRRFWSTNRSGYCLAPTCHLVQEDLEHLLVVCPSMEHVRHRLHSLWCLKTADCPPLQRLIMQMLGSAPEILLRFILDSTALPQLITLVQVFGQEIQDRVCYLTRTWAFAIHRQKMKMLGRWPGYGRNNTNKAMPKIGPNPAPNFGFIPPLSHDLSQTNYYDLKNDPYISCPTINMISNDVTFPVMSTVPHQTSTSPPSSTTTPAAGCATPLRCSTTLPASSSVLEHDVELFVPDLSTVHHDQPPDALPGPYGFTNTNSSVSQLRCGAEQEPGRSWDGSWGHGLPSTHRRRSPTARVSQYTSQPVCHANCQNSCTCSQPYLLFM